MPTIYLNDAENAFARGDISILNFIEILIDGFGPKKASKMLRKNVAEKMKKEGFTKQEIDEQTNALSIVVQCYKKKLIWQQLHQELKIKDPLKALVEQKASNSLVRLQ